MMRRSARIAAAIAACAIRTSAAAQEQTQAAPSATPASPPAVDGVSQDAAQPIAAVDKHARNVAERREERDRRWYATIFVMENAEARLPEFPYKIVSATLPLRGAYLVSAAVDRVVVPRFRLPLPFFSLRGNSLDLEAQSVQHFGHERDTEVTASAIVRSGQFGILGRTSANVAWGNGLSYAITAPTYELGPTGQVGMGTKHLQYHMSFETEVTSGANPRLHYVLRLHHRSGIYGIISPSRTGSNYLGLGLRFDLGRH